MNFEHLIIGIKSNEKRNVLGFIVYINIELSSIYEYVTIAL